MNSGQSTRRADRVRDWIATRLYDVAYRIAAPDREADLPRCPDCQIGPDVGDNCPVCAQHHEQQIFEHAMYTAGFQDAWEARCDEEDTAA